MPPCPRVYKYESSCGRTHCTGMVHERHAAGPSGECGVVAPLIARDAAEPSIEDRGVLKPSTPDRFRRCPSTAGRCGRLPPSRLRRNIATSVESGRCRAGGGEAGSFSSRLKRGVEDDCGNFSAGGERGAIDDMGRGATRSALLMNAPDRPSWRFWCSRRWRRIASSEPSAMHATTGVMSRPNTPPGQGVSFVHDCPYGRRRASYDDRRHEVWRSARTEDGLDARSYPRAGHVDAAPDRCDDGDRDGPEKQELSASASLYTPATHVERAQHSTLDDRKHKTLQGHP